MFWCSVAASLVLLAPVKAFVMRLLHPVSVAAILVPLAGLLGACSSESTFHGRSGEGGAGGAVPESTSATMGSSGGEAADAAALDSAAYCPGDAKAWHQLTAQPSPCQDDTECCVIVSPCLSEAQIIGAAQQDEASKAWPYCDVACVDCVPPAIAVACIQGTCLGRAVSFAPPDSPLRKDHCGDDVKMIDLSGKTGLHFGCGD